MDYEKYKKILAERLTEKRYHHSLCVADEAKRLAKKYGVDEQKAYLSGLLHDITKNTNEIEQLKLLYDFDILLDSVSKKSEKLWHAISGAAYIKNVLKIDDDEIIDAVRYHTTAKADMSLLAKVLYLADFTSADRDYDDVNIMRKLVDKSLEHAMIYALKYTINDLVARSKQVHPDTLAAYNQVIQGELNNAK